MNKTLQQEKDFLLLIESHKRVIYKVCYMYATDDELLNDLYQEIVMNLWRAYPSFRGESSPATWIYRISLNTCISYRRKSKHQILIYFYLFAQYYYLFEKKSLAIVFLSLHFAQQLIFYLDIPYMH